MIALLVALCPAMLSSQSTAQAVRKTNLAKDTFLFSATEGNLVLYDGAGGWVVAGVQSPALVRAAQSQIDLRPARKLAYAIALVSDSAAGYADGGWAFRGAVTIAHENLRHRMGGRSASRPPNALPSVGFSEVIQLYVPGEDTHAVHQKPGYSDADVSVHFERAGVLMLGAIFTTDGYPAIDTAHGGSFSGLLETVTTFANNFGSSPTIVPARGPAVAGRVLRDYAAMLSAVGARVKRLADSGQTLDQVIAAKPTADFDARWGRGPVPAATFVAAIYASFKK